MQPISQNLRVLLRKSLNISPIHKENNTIQISESTDNLVKSLNQININQNLYKNSDLIVERMFKLKNESILQFILVPNFNRAIIRCRH